MGTSTGTRHTPAFNPASSGTAQSPIVFVAEYPAAYNASQRSELRNNASAIDTGSPTFGAFDRHDIVWDGFYVDEANAHSHSDTGPVVGWGSQRVRFCRNVIKGHVFDRQDNHTGIRFEGTSDSEVTANEIFDVRSASSASQNFAAIQSYDAQDILIANNSFHDNDVDVFIKGQHAVPTQNASWVIRNNRMERARWAAVHLLSVNVQTGLQRTVVSQNLIVEPRVAFHFHNGFGDREPSDTDIENNTVIGATEGFLAVVYGSPGSLGLHAVKVKRNLVVDGTGCYFNEINGDVLGNLKARGFDLDDDHYFGQTYVASVGSPNGGNYSTVAAFASGTEFGVAGTGFERNGSQGDPLFVNAGAGDYHLQASSPARTAAVGGTAVGCYVTGSEAVGIP